MPKSWQRCVTSLSDLLERAFIEQEFDALAGGQLAFLVLPLAPLRSAAGFGGRVPPAQLFEPAHWITVAQW